MSAKVSLVAAAALILVGCVENDDGGDARAQSQLVTLFDMKTALVAGQRVARTASFPDGFNPADFLQPVVDKYAVKPHAAYSEGQPAAFVTTEIWVNYDEVWAQPGYFLITAWNEMAPFSSFLRGPDGTRAPLIYDVGERSAFYSPFWKFFFAVVPPNTPLDKYDDSVKLFNDEVPIYPSILATYSLVPDDVGVSETLPHPTFGTPVRGLSLSPVKSWVNGQQVSYLLQGVGNFRVDEQLVVEEAPFFMFVARGPNGAPQPLPVPPVIGAVPLFSSRATPVGMNPTFGAFTRVYFVSLPPTAAAFDAAADPAVVETLGSKGLDARAYQGRMALNGKPPIVMGMPSGTSCFQDAAFPASCVWLDSQKQIEDRLGPANIRKTEVTRASPIVDFGIPRGMP